MTLALPTLQNWLDVATEAVLAAGVVLEDLWGNLTDIQEKGQSGNLVTEADQTAEALILDILTRHCPDHAILAEESGTHGQSDYLWAIDPLDGTTNFIHGFPQYAVSIALMQKGVVTQAVVYDPSRDELFTASRGRGAYLNGRRIRVSKRIRIEESLIGTGFPFRKLDMLDGYLAMMRVVMERAAGLRRPGAAALDLAYVAAGRLDGFFELGLAPWDAAAGSLLITEAGGMVGNFGAEGDYLFSEQIVAGTPKVFSGLIALLHRHVVAAEAAAASGAASSGAAAKAPSTGEASTDDARRDPTRRAIRPIRKRVAAEPDAAA